MRVVHHGGRAVFVLAKPNALRIRLRAQPPLPCWPMRLGWMKRRLGTCGDGKITGYAVPSVQFDRRLSETTTLGRLVWRAIQWLEARQAVVTARLGCYVLIVVSRNSGAPFLRVTAAKHWPACRRPAF